MKRIMLVILVVATGCGRESTRVPASRLELVVPDTTIDMQGGQTREIQLLVVGAKAEQVNYSAELPAFARLAGSLLTLTPTRSDAGSYKLTVTATAGNEST